ncbi:MAG: sigma-70 family RNA polymerase sigma factor [Verrucomicrobiota bacterium]
MPTTEPSTEFIQLLTTHQSRLYAYALSLMGDRQQALEVMQETNLVMWRKRDQFQLGTNFGAWMLKIAYFQVLSHRRKLNRQAIFIEDESFLSELAVEVEESSAFIEEQQAALSLCITKLPERQRDLVRRRYSEGGSIRSVAEQTGSVASAVKQALFRARNNLIDCVRRQMKEQGA